MDNNPNNPINQEMIHNIISLENEIKLLKEVNKKQEEKIKNLKKKAISLEKFDTYLMNDLFFNNVDLNQNKAIIKNEESSVQYGPYKKYPEGKYRIVYYGKNLHNLLYDCCDNKGKNLLKIIKLYEFSNKFAYDVFLPKNNNCIEFRARGKKIVKKLLFKIKKNKKKIPKSIIEKIEVYKFNNC